MKVLIVDDEVSNVEMICQEIDWTGLFIDEVLTAEDGEEAKEIILEAAPDILLCDVEMPRVNGLELIRWIKERELNMEIIILSCHDKFSYAQTAIYYGVREYLVKPFHMEELHISLTKAVFAARQKNAKTDKPEEQIYLQQGILQLLYSKEVVTERGLRDLLENGVGALQADVDYRMLYIGVNQSDLNACGFTKREFGFILENITTELLGLTGSESRHITSTENPFHFLIYFLEDDKTAIRESCEKLLKVGKEYLKIPLYCCLTEEARLLHVAEQREAVTAYFLKELKLGNSSFHILGELQKENKVTDMELNEDVLANYLRQEKFAEFTGYIREQMVALSKEGKLNLAALQKMEQMVSHALYRLCDERGIPVSAVFSEETVLKLQKEAAFGIPSMLKYISYTVACIQKQQKVGKDDWGIVDQAKKYIAEHYAEDIGRTDIADACHVSQGYLSKLFSDSLGMNMREYINLYRVNEAKRLLRNPGNSIGFVAMEVGFDNLSYFSTIFKKACGETPAEWRKKIFL